MRAAVPTGTVDLFTTTAPGASTERISSTTASTALRSATPPTPIGVGTHRNTTSAGPSRSARSANAAAAPTTNDSLPAAMPGLDQLGQPVLADPDLAATQPLDLPRSRSAQLTRWPKRREAGARRQADIARPDHRDPTCEHQKPLPFDCRRPRSHVVMEGVHAGDRLRAPDCSKGARPSCMLALP